ncbi:winged helix-turn-helix transcriptional regulator [Nocardia sp. CA-151230]|uniref:winged helix-turn-helix transcriptional regulator n=1 Tax=Nocardia sp. CA-151230 TaxID=3239982 RepID=UPI003D8D7CDF
MARALSVIGERWSLLIVREALDGASRFGEFRDRLGIASNLLTTRLDGLVEAALLEWGDKYLADPDGPSVQRMASERSSNARYHNRNRRRAVVIRSVRVRECIPVCMTRRRVAGRSIPRRVPAA